MIDYKNTTTPTECELVLAVVDLARFARTAQTMSDRAIFDMLGEFYELIGKFVAEAGGTVVKFMGDAALIVFAGDAPDHAVRSLRSLRDATDDWLAAYNSALRLQIRVHLGRVACGPLGAAGDKRFDVVGREVNELFLMRGGDFALSDRLEQRLAQDRD